ncbi:V-type proton ATPase subunit C 1-B isoform X2 [Denticeps clupeoides]|uniref:V-type proton ATPase subunit C 1-B isoform X2 n=1 Tax=Denticeps clupeoides TaxID=299321 RepID=UPI0010A41FFA|nr:V-type proton ATPase subunit C 1-B-like isoform X2 [Denticeps clupeoides]
MADFWLISVPLDMSSTKSLEKLKRAASKANLASSFRFPIPEFKTGTLDVLLAVSEDLSRLDSCAESVMRKTSQCMAEVMEPNSYKVLENSDAIGDLKNPPKVSRLKSYFQRLMVDLATYVTHFQWDRAKYSTALPLKSLAEIMFKQVTQVEVELRSRNSAYTNVKKTLQSIELKREQNLHTRTLTDVVKAEDLVLGSEYLMTLIVIVGRESYAEWERSYESLSEFVVPRSSRKILEEADAGMFTVTLFKKAACEFKANAKKNKFMVRDFSLEEAEQWKQERLRLSVEEKEQHGIFVRWLKVNFSEVFVAWVHVKALRVFVESVLRYGLPVSFQAVLLQPERKSEKKLRHLLSSLFTHLDPAAIATKQDMTPDIPGVSVGQQEYYSYICYSVSFNIVDVS